MIFSQGYYHAMDRDYHTSAPEQQPSSEPLFSVRDIGQSVPLGIAATDVHGISSKIRMGAGTLEIGFPTAGRGQRQAQSPEMWGKDARQALQELAKANEIRLTTHAAYNVYGYSGQDQQGNFSKEQRKLAVDEAKRAIEFAADTAGGGPVVVHTGEYERPISEEPYAMGGKLVRQYTEEPERAIFRVVDDRTGQVMDQVRKNRKIGVAEWNIAENDMKGKWQIIDEETIKRKPEAWQKKYMSLVGKETAIRKGDYIDYEGNKILDPLDVEHGRLPQYDKETGRFKVNEQDWNYFVQESKKWNDLREKQLGRQLTEWEKMYPEERYLRATLETNEGYSRGWALQFSIGVKDDQKKLTKLRKALEFYERLEKDIPENEKWKIIKEQPEFGGIVGQFIPSETKIPSEILKEAIWQTERSMAYHWQSGMSQEKQALDSRETQLHIKSARKYAINESVRSYAEAGIYAMQESEKRKLQKPLFIAMENIFPERYGSHLSELKTLIDGAREEMVKRLSAKQLEDPTGATYSHQEAAAIGRLDLEGMPRMVANQPVMSAEEAKKKAEQHLKATIDTGHINLWRKYFQGSEEDFKRWMLGQVEDLAKGGYIGHVHWVDNFGYQDDHLSPGQGNAAALEQLKIIKKYGYHGTIQTEPGADATTDAGDFWGVMKAWRLSGSNIYGAAPAQTGGGGNGGRWGEVQYSYFGQNRPPYFVFGSYSPSQDWQLWSQVPFE